MVHSQRGMNIGLYVIVLIPCHVNPLMGTLKFHSNGLAITQQYGD